MIFHKFMRPSSMGRIALLAGVVALAGCASEDIDDTTGSRLQQPAFEPGTQPPPPIEAGDVAIAAQEFSHSIRELPQIANDTTPALVRFAGVTSIVKNQDKQIVDIDTTPYTTLLRDRLLLGDREKLRFVERQLPPLSVPHKKGHKDEDEQPSGDIGTGEPDYQVLAELRGRVDADYYRIQMEFVDIHSGAVLFNATYRIRKEAPDSGGEQISEQDVPSQPTLPAHAAPANSAETGVPPVPGVDDNSVPSQGTFNPPPPPQ
jgi:PBP1b-binding outer membrane lipoprotein LpoB